MKRTQARRLSGRYAIDTTRARVRGMAASPVSRLLARLGPAGRSRPRYRQVAGSVLTLTTGDEDGQPLSVARWQKSSAHAP